MGPTQLAEVLRALPASVHPDLVVGFDTSDDAAVFRLSDQTTLVQTIDFFPPIVDDPYAYGQIAAANALSDVYAMGGTPVTALNIACFDPDSAPSEVWSAVMKGMADKCQEAKCVLVGGHTVQDPMPKFGLTVTGILTTQNVFKNTQAKQGDKIYLSKPLGTGIITTAAKFDESSEKQLQQAIESMSKLNSEASRVAIENEVQCATDITGFGLAGHLWNVAKASNVTIEIEAQKLPMFEGLYPLIEKGNITAGSKRNKQFVGDSLVISSHVPAWMLEVVFDPQTSGGLAMFSKSKINDFQEIGKVSAGGPKIILR